MIPRVAACENLLDLPKQELEAQLLLFVAKRPINNQIKTDFDDFPSRESSPGLSPRVHAPKANG